MPTGQEIDPEAVKLAKEVAADIGLPGRVIDDYVATKTQASNPASPELQLASTLNSGLVSLNSGLKPAARETLQRFSAGLNSSLTKAYETGGIDQLTATINKIDAAIDGEGVGLYGTRDGQSVRVYAVRPVDPSVAKILDTAKPSNDTFINVGGRWFESLSKTSLDLGALDQNGRKKSEFEKLEGKPIEDTAVELSNRVKSDISRFNGQGVSESLIKSLSTAISRIEGVTDLQESINRNLKGTGYSVELNYTYGLNGLHGDTVVQTIVAVKDGEKTIARQLEQHDTVRSWGSAKNLSFEQTGVIKSDDSIPERSKKAASNVDNSEFGKGAKLSDGLPRMSGSALPFNNTDGSHVSVFDPNFRGVPTLLGPHDVNDVSSSALVKAVKTAEGRTAALGYYADLKDAAGKPQIREVLITETNGQQYTLTRAGLSDRWLDSRSGDVRNLDVEQAGGRQINRTAEIAIVDKADAAKSDFFAPMGRKAPELLKRLFANSGQDDLLNIVRASETSGQTNLGIIDGAKVVESEPALDILRGRTATESRESKPLGEDALRTNSIEGKSNYGVFRTVGGIATVLVLGGAIAAYLAKQQQQKNIQLEMESRVPKE